MARMLNWFGLAALGVSLTGCVAQDKYNALKLERDRYAEQLTAAQTEASTAKAEADVLRQQVNALAQGGQAVVLAGGLGLRLVDYLPRSGFHDRFIAKGRFERMMGDMPVKVIVHPQPGLFGAAAAFASAHVDL